jgi:hypothetical protein
MSEPPQSNIYCGPKELVATHYPADAIAVILDWQSALSQGDAAEPVRTGKLAEVKK